MDSNTTEIVTEYLDTRLVLGERRAWIMDALNRGGSKLLTKQRFMEIAPVDMSPIMGSRLANGYHPQLPRLLDDEFIKSMKMKGALKQVRGTIRNKLTQMDPNGTQWFQLTYDQYVSIRAHITTTVHSEENLDQNRSLSSDLKTTQETTVATCQDDMVARAMIVFNRDPELINTMYLVINADGNVRRTKFIFAMSSLYDNMVLQLATSGGDHARKQVGLLKLEMNTMMAKMDKMLISNNRIQDQLTAAKEDREVFKDQLTAAEEDREEIKDELDDARDEAREDIQNLNTRLTTAAPTQGIDRHNTEYEPIIHVRHAPNTNLYKVFKGKRVNLRTFITRVNGEGYTQLTYEIPNCVNPKEILRDVKAAHHGGLQITGSRITITGNPDNVWALFTAANAARQTIFMVLDHEDIHRPQTTAAYSFLWYYVKDE